MKHNFIYIMKNTHMMKKKSRREFLKLAALSCAGIVSGCAVGGQGRSEDLSYLKYGATRKFRMKFTPRLGMGYKSTAGKNMLQRMDFFRDAGFTAVEGAVFVVHNGADYSEKEKQFQLELGRHARALGLEMGNVSSMNEKDFAMMTEFQMPVKGKAVFSKDGVREELYRRMDKTFGVLERIGSKTFIIGAGTRGECLPYLKQLDNVVENMSMCAKYARGRGFVMEIEPLCTQAHPGIFINTASLGAEIAAAVDNTSCRILLDVFHEQMQTGSLASLDDDNVWRYIESFHLADAPTRQEPTTGVIDFPRVLKKIWDRGFRGFIGLEHGQSVVSKERDMQIFQIYRDLDTVIDA